MQTTPLKIYISLWNLRYTCTDQMPTFLGCCTSNPCNGVGCPSSDLRAAGMGTGSGPDSTTNDSSYWPNVQCAEGQWWTCSRQTPSFQGCCETNPCGGDGDAGGCPSNELSPAAFKAVTTDTQTPDNQTPGIQIPGSQTTDSNRHTDNRHSDNRHSDNRYSDNRHSNNNFKSNIDTTSKYCHLVHYFDYSWLCIAAVNAHQH